MNKILILFGHPAFRRSTINAALREAVETLDGVTFHDLYASYPDFLIDVRHEQRLCESHDIIIFQHPFYWYSTPAIVKEWFDLVLEHAWAYGSSGNALAGKITFQALTAGGKLENYCLSLRKYSKCRFLNACCFPLRWPKVVNSPLFCIGFIGRTKTDTSPCTSSTMPI